MNRLIKTSFLLIVMFHNFSNAGDLIEPVESHSGVSATRKFRIPKPIEGGWEKLQAHWALQTEKIDNVFVEINFPKEWRVEEYRYPADQNRNNNRHGVIFDHKNRKIGIFSIRDSWTWYCGATIFDSAIVDEIIAEQTTAF